jgi:hypothetical protein
MDLSHRPLGYECHHQQNLKTMRCAKSNALFSRRAKHSLACPCIAHIYYHRPAAEWRFRHRDLDTHTANPCLPECAGTADYPAGCPKIDRLFRSPAARQPFSSYKRATPIGRRSQPALCSGPRQWQLLRTAQDVVFDGQGYQFERASQLARK